MKKGLLKEQIWFEDINRNIYYKKEDIPEDIIKSGTVTYHSRFVAMLVEDIDRVTEDGKFEHLGEAHDTYNEKLAIAMVNSGDYTFKEAVLTLVDCCERCLNILHNKYLGEKNFSKWYFYDKWDRHCNFCEPDDDKYFEDIESSDVSLSDASQCCCSPNRENKNDDQ